MAPPTRTEIAAAVETLFVVLDDDHTEAFERIAVSAGLLSRCDCGQNVPVDQTSCDRCGAPVNDQAPAEPRSWFRRLADQHLAPYRIAGEGQIDVEQVLNDIGDDATYLFIESNITTDERHYVIHAGPLDAALADWSDHIDPYEGWVPTLGFDLRDGTPIDVGYDVRVTAR